MWSKELKLSTRDIFQDMETFIIKQDSVTCPVVKVCKNWFKNIHIPVLEWSGHSPCLNLIEYL